MQLTYATLCEAIGMRDIYLYARAMPERVDLTETYSYRQDISRNSTYHVDCEPQGQIKISVPYDGYRYFTRDAYADICRRPIRKTGEGQPQLATIGHLAFDNTARTNIEDVMDLIYHNSVPIRIPITGEMIPSLTDLISDQLKCDHQAAYKIKEPQIWPIAIEVDVRDEEALQQMRTAPGTATSQRVLEDTAGAITQRLSARETLCISFIVRITIPGGDLPEHLSPTVKHMSLKWPAPIAREAFRMNLSTEPSQQIRCSYDPFSRCLEWDNIALMLTKATDKADFHVYESAEILLWVEQPGELYDQTKMTGEVHVEIPDWLFSGVQVRYFDSMGYLVNNPPCSLLTRLRIRFQLNLDDAFRHRILSPRYHLHFDQVIPDDMSVLYLRTAIMDRGFRIVRDERVVPDGSQSLDEASDLRHFIEAKRPEGSATMWLWVVVTGRLYQSSRRTRVPGGQRYTSTVESGELVIHLVGQLAGNGHLLTQEMNALHRSLRDRYDRLRAMR